VYISVDTTRKRSPVERSVAMEKIEGMMVISFASGNRSKEVLWNILPPNR
jgi:hypothetical protein